MTIHQVPNRGFGELLVNSGDGPCLIVNRDLVSQLLIGKDNSVFSKGATGDVSVVDPLGSVAVNGREALYGMGLQASGTISVDIMKNASYWAPSPAQVAAQINALGLAKDTTVAAVQANTNGVAKDVTVGNVHTDLSLGTNQFLSGASVGALTANPGGTVAGDISKTGAPLLNLKGALANNAGTLISGNSSVTLGPFAISQISYEFLLSITTAAVTATPLLIEVFWTDTTSGLSAGYQAFTVFAATIAVAHQVTGRGPSIADRVSVKISTLTANSATVAYSLLQSSRPFFKDIWQTSNFIQPAFPTFPGFTAAGTFEGSKVLANAASSIAAGGNLSFLLPLYDGNVFWNGRTTSATVGDGEWRLNDPSGILGFILDLATSGQAGFTQSGGGASSRATALPRLQCAVQMFNHNAAAQTLSFNMIAAQD